MLLPFNDILKMCNDFKSKQDAALITPSDIVTELNGYDVLLGRSVPKWKCSGNGIFRKLIANFGDEYRSLNKHVYKDEIARRILLTIRALGGRFLRQLEPLSVRERHNIDSDTEAWVEVDEETSLQKVKQALRDLPHNSKSPIVPALVKENFEVVPKMFALSLDDIKLSRYTLGILSGTKGYSHSRGNVSRFPYRKRQTSKVADIILAHRKNEYMTLHNLTISTQLRLLKQHQGQRVDQVMKGQRYRAPLRRNISPSSVCNFRPTGNPPILAATSVKKIYVR